MNKDEARLAVMGAISMALKDPTLQQGFEIICKENAELKKDNEGYEKDNTLLVNRFNQTSAKLIKAKEMLRKLVLEVKSYEEINGNDTCEPVQEAEQFLSEVEK